MATFKRARSPPTHSLSPSSSTLTSPTLKAARTSASPPPDPSTSSASAPSHILCSLPPTCNPPNRPTALAGTRELEQHYAMYHAHVCEEKGCRCVFPDARLLELHQTECHDPLAAVRKDRGEKIFACHLPDCPRKFLTPKARRLHLIEAHGFPKEYFFAVTNKGVGGLLKKWGEGASMLRKPWRARENGADGTREPGGDDVDNDNDEDSDADETEDTLTSARDAAEDHEGSDDEDQILFEKIQIDRPSHAAAQGKTQTRNGHAHGTGRAQLGEVDTLADALDSLSLVPTSIQFGRGAKRGARGHTQTHTRSGSGGRGGHRGGGGGGDNDDGADGMDVDLATGANGGVRGRGRGWVRGGGRGAPPKPPRGGALRGMAWMGGRGGAMVRGTSLRGAGVVRGGARGRGAVTGRGGSKS